MPAKGELPSSLFRSKMRVKPLLFVNTHTTRRVYPKVASGVKVTCSPNFKAKKDLRLPSR